MAGRVLAAESNLAVFWLLLLWGSQGVCSCGLLAWMSHILSVNMAGPCSSLAALSLALGTAPPLSWLQGVLSRLVYLLLVLCPAHCPHISVAWVSSLLIPEVK